MFQVFAARSSAITSGMSLWQLMPYGTGYAFQCVQTGTWEHGSFTEGPDKFEALRKFREVSGDLSVSFELL